jgi:hypothetical protein
MTNARFFLFAMIGSTFARLRGKDRSRPAQQAEYNGGEDRPKHFPFRTFAP